MPRLDATRGDRNPCRPLRGLAAAALAVMLLAGATVPAFAQGLTLRGLRGEELRESDLAQGATIIVVWASWSPHGKDVVARVNALNGRWGRRARVVTVNFQEDRAAIEAFLRGSNLAVPVFLDADGAFSKKYAVTSLPGLLVFKDGKTAYRGKLPEDPDTVLGELLG